jgi:hypothetical protein
MSGQLDRYFSKQSLPVQAYRALEDVLKNDDVLKLIPITWDVRRGERDEAMPPAPRQMPWIALVPLEMPIARSTEIEDGAKFRVRIDIAVQGTCWDDLANLAMAVYDALAYNKPFNADMTVDQYICARQGINRYYVKQGGVGVRRTETPPVDSAVSSPPPIADQVAAAIVEFDLFLPTIQ